MNTASTHPVEYFKITGAPGDYFKCPRYHGNATLSTTACAGQFQRAQAGGEDARIRLYACINCPIGARHAGITDFIPLNQIQTSKICVRCHRPAARIIRKCLCVSCINRQYELEKGRNARGNKPKNCQPLHPINVLVREENRKPKPAQYVATGMLEAMLTAIKTTSGQVAIAFRGPQPRPAAEQSLLFPEITPCKRQRQYAQRHARCSTTSIEQLALAL